jgi:glycine cleavage system transcriptional repressor
MKKYMILFSVGKDRPGIVDDVSSLLFERGGNIEDSRMAAMGGRFSIITLFSCTSEQLETIKAGLDDLKELGLETSLHQAEDPTAIPTQPALPLKFDLMSMDHPGIVQKVVHLLHQHNVNIQSLNTQVARAPLSGAPLFDLTLEASVPAEKQITKVKDELMKLAAQMNLDLSFKK